MTTKRAIATGLVAAAAGAGAYFLLSKRYEPTRRRLSAQIRKKAKLAADEASELAGRLRRNTKETLKDVAEITDKAAKNL